MRYYLFDLTEEDMQKLKNALINFIIRVSSSDLTKPEELALLPVMTEIVLGYFSKRD